MEGIYKGQGLIRNLTLSTTYSAGRNITGRITIYHRGGGTKPRLRLVYYKRMLNLPCRIMRIEKDTHRTAYIALIIYYPGIFSYILAPHGISQKSLLMSGAHADIKDGNHCPLLFIPAGVFLHNIELKLQHFGQIVRSAGNKGLLLRHKRLVSLIRLPSGEIRFFNIFCSATLGTISHITHKFDTIYTKAGHIRHIGYRPHVRGVAMNPVDHPHGGGHGKTSTGRAPTNAWGKLTKGPRTRKTNRRKYLYLFKARYESKK